MLCGLEGRSNDWARQGADEGLGSGASTTYLEALHVLGESLPLSAARVEFLLRALRHLLGSTLPAGDLSQDVVQAALQLGHSLLADLVLLDQLAPLPLELLKLANVLGHLGLESSLLLLEPLLVCQCRLEAAVGPGDRGAIRETLLCARL